MTQYLTPFLVEADLVLVVWVAAGFLLGGAPASYFIARAMGRDLLAESSGAAGFTAVSRVLGVRRGVLALVADAGKAALVTELALRFASLEVAGWTAVACVLGYQWPLWLRFRGGRGLTIALAVGMTLGIWEGWIPVATTVLARLLLKDAAPGSFLGLVAAGVILFFVREPGAVPVYGALMVILLLSSRVIGFRPARAGDEGGVLRRLAIRLVFDRDTIARAR